MKLLRSKLKTIEIQTICDLCFLNLFEIYDYFTITTYSSANVVYLFNHNGQFIFGWKISSKYSHLNCHIVGWPKSRLIKFSETSNTKLRTVNSELHTKHALQINIIQWIYIFRRIHFCFRNLVCTGILKLKRIWLRNKRTKRNID